MQYLIYMVRLIYINKLKHFLKKIDTIILVDKVKVINTKKGDQMSFITGSDETASMEYTLFPKVYNV